MNSTELRNIRFNELIEETKKELNLYIGRNIIDNKAELTRIRKHKCELRARILKSEVGFKDRVILRNNKINTKLKNVIEELGGIDI